VKFSARLAVDLLYRSSQSRKRVYMTSSNNIKLLYAP